MQEVLHDVAHYGDGRKADAREIVLGYGEVAIDFVAFVSRVRKKDEIRPDRQTAKSDDRSPTVNTEAVGYNKGLMHGDSMA